MKLETWLLSCPSVQVSTYLSYYGHQLVHRPGLLPHQLPAAGVQGGRMPYQQHIPTRLLSSLKDRVLDKACVKRAP